MHSAVAPAPKRATNRSLSVKVLDGARELGPNRSQTVDCLLAEEVRRPQAEAWLERNRAGAIGRHVEPQPAQRP